MAVTKASTPAKVVLPQRVTTEDGLNEVVKSGDLKAVQAAVQALEQQQKITVECFREGLIISAEKGYSEVFEWLKKHKSTITVHEINHTPIHLGLALCRAAANGHGRVVEQIVKVRVYEGKTSIALTHGIPHINPHEVHKTQTSKISFVKVANGLQDRASFLIPDDLLLAARMASQHCHIPIVQAILSESKDLCSRVRKLTKEDPAAKGLSETAALAYVLLHDRTLPPSDGKALDDKTYERFRFVAESAHYGAIQSYLKKGDADVLPGLLVRMAAEKGHPYVIEAMMKLMLPLSEADRGIAVQNAAENGHIEVVRLLMGSGNISDRDRDLAITKTEKSHPAIVELLQNNPTPVIQKALEMGQIKLK